MTIARRPAQTAIVLMAALLAGAVTMAVYAQNAGSIGDKDAVLIDGRKFEVQPAKARAVVGDLVKTLGAREIGPGAIIFRSGDKLYIVDAVPGGGQMDLMFEGAFAPPG